MVPCMLESKSQRLWRNWQTRYLEVVVEKSVQVRVLPSAPFFPLFALFKMKNTNRRRFLKSTGTAAIFAGVAPAFLRAQDKAGTRNAIIGEGAHQYECLHDWGQLPAHIKWGETHGVAIDGQGFVYIKHRSHTPEPMDAIVIFDGKGNYVRSFGKEFHGGGHGIDVRKEGNAEHLYLSDTRNGVVAKTTLKGESIWAKKRPVETGKYDDPKSAYSPTNIGFAADGGFYIADGYGSHFIHQYDKDAKWLRSWGGIGNEPGQLKTPHGLWLDDRPGRQPALAVCDRANARLQYFTPDGKHVGLVKDVSFPANIDIRGELMLVSDLHARVTLFDKDNKVIAHLGNDPEWTKKVLANNFELRQMPQLWEKGRFIHPHDACFDLEGNIYVVEWVPTGRVTKLRKLA